MQGTPALLDWLRGRPRHTADMLAARDTNWQHFENPLPPGLELQWLGTAGFRLAYEGTEIWIDPYLSRSSFRQVAGGGRLGVGTERLEGLVRRADAVLVGHTHFDHALDVPWIAERHHCPVYGSRSLAKLMELYGAAERCVEVEAHRPYEVGPFRIRFVPSRHSKLLLGLKVPSDGELSCECLDDLGAGAYRCGQVFGIHIEVAGARLYHQGSANLIEEEIRERGVDIFLCGIAGRVFTPRYVERVLRRLEPKIVVPHHHDDFFRPVEAKMGFSFNVNFGGFLEEVRRVSQDFAVRALDPLQTLGSAHATPTVTRLTRAGTKSPESGELRGE